MAPIYCKNKQAFLVLNNYKYWEILSDDSYLLDDDQEMWRWKIRIAVVADATMSSYYSIGMNLDAYVKAIFQQVADIFRYYLL